MTDRKFLTDRIQTADAERDRIGSRHLRSILAPLPKIKDHPLPCTAAEVRAFLAGIKTQIRRLKVSWVPGDRLWGQHTLTCMREVETGGIYFDVKYGDGLRWEDYSEDRGIHEKWLMEYQGWYRRGLDTQDIPARDMPRWASRITLLVKRVWAKRLQDISGADCIDEGATNGTDLNMRLSRSDQSPFHEQRLLLARSDFGTFWDSTHKKPGTRWADNPRVWATEFELLEEKGHEA